MAGTTPSQQFVPIKEIRDGVVVLKDGGLRAVLLATAVNLGLKSGEEQQATLSQFQLFLNSLEFPVQIVASSRRLDIRPYLSLLEERLAKIPEELLRLQTKEYIEFIRDFNDRYNIMSKFFYVVVPFDGATIPTKKGASGILSFFSKSKKTAQSVALETFEESRSQLEQRISVVVQGLSSMGIESKKLKTAELIDLYHSSFNPGELHSQAGNRTQYQMYIEEAYRGGILSQELYDRYRKEEDTKRQRDILGKIMTQTIELRRRKEEMVPRG